MVSPDLQQAEKVLECRTGENHVIGLPDGDMRKREFEVQHALQIPAAGVDCARTEHNTKHIARHKIVLTCGQGVMV